MKNSLLEISEHWETKRDEFYEIDPFDKTIDEDTKFLNLFCQQDLLWIKKSAYNLDLGWYGGSEDGHFGLYLFKGKNWHDCALLEKRNTNDYQLIIQLINHFTQNVDLGRYESINITTGPVDLYLELDSLTVLNDDRMNE